VLRGQRLLQPFRHRATPTITNLPMLEPEARRRLSAFSSPPFANRTIGTAIAPFAERALRLHENHRP